MENTNTAPASRWSQAVILFIGLLCSTVIIYNAYWGGWTALLLRSSFFSLIACAGFVVAMQRCTVSWLRVPYVALALLALCAGPYLYINYLDIVMGGAIAEPLDVKLFVATLLCTLLLVRIYVGWTMLIMAVAALGYALFGNFIPGSYGHAGYSLSRLASNLFLRTEGIYGLPMGVAAEYIFLFSLLGALLLKTGLGKVFVDIAQALTGRIQGGPGLTAVVSSTMFSAINGSAVAGVVTTGTFTIPLMKRSGYRAKVAGAIEAAASSAGQIMPPVMGAAAFIMAEMTQLPYATIAAAALIPALLYVFALLVSVRLEAGKFNLPRLEKSDVPLLTVILRKQGYMLLPLVALIGFLIYGFTPAKCAVLSMVATLLLSSLKKETRLTFSTFFELIEETVRNVLPVVAAVAVAGIVIGVLTLTGLALKLSAMILWIGGVNLIAVLLLTMAASFLLGLGLPTSAAYLLLAILIAPALVKFGVPVIAAHMFIFYYGLLSAITPPVALAAYAGASIAGAGPTETAVEAIRMGFVKVIAPFLFVFWPGLLLTGSTYQTVLGVWAGFSVIFALSVVFSGWWGRLLTALEKTLLVTGAAIMAFSQNTPSTELFLFIGTAIVFAALLKPTQYWRASVSA
jgi:TRAP transporter 4TM/12TM fusion protein